jgi:hypothetical protein
MRKTVGGLVLAAALIVPAGLSAQTQSGTVNATARILAVLDVTNADDLDFGDIVPGNGASVLPGSAPGGAGQTLGALRIEHNSDFTVSATVPANLSLGAETLAVTFTCGYSASATGAVVGGTSDCGSVANPGTAASASTTVTFLQVGGTIAAAETSGKTPGNYTGSMTFTFTSTF